MEGKKKKKIIRGGVLSGMKKRKREEVESSEEEEEEKGIKIKLEKEMLVKIDGRVHYMTDYGEIKNILFSYPEGKLCGQYMENTGKVAHIDLEY